MVQALPPGRCKAFAKLLGIGATTSAAGATRGGRGARERILRGEAELFCTRGIHATGVAALVQAAHVAPRTFYAHFPTKNARPSVHAPSTTPGCSRMPGEPPRRYWTSRWALRPESEPGRGRGLNAGRPRVRPPASARLRRTPPRAAV
ncbi:helix-turn-helix domain-containing protein [Streptomyces sp. NPDC002120]|uniref:helix-turn-helix domain-containing protein n=1 Tax=Streptomyces sp. NPDC002120 TaxID=3364631 RepID=UPI0036CC6391